jgi:hypothetical protein
MPGGQGHAAYLTMYREEDSMYSRTATKTVGGAPPLESNRRRKPAVCCRRLTGGNTRPLAGLQRRRHPESHLPDCR